MDRSLQPSSLTPLLYPPFTQVKIARSQNKTRRHGLGNHWVTGHQKLIKHYKVRGLSGHPKLIKWWDECQGLRNTVVRW